MPSERIWHKGPPPHIGWWLTRNTKREEREWRWWNGTRWSVYCLEGETGKDGNLPTSRHLSSICWSDYWPENARVPRIDPRKEPSNAQ